VRHEAAEALGAIGDAAALRVLEEFEQSDCLEVFSLLLYSVLEP